MQNKGIVKFVAVVLSLICIFYLSFSAVTKYHESKAEALGEEAGAAYLDSISNEKIYLGTFTYKECQEMEIGLGLDLKGGMNVILEVSVPDVVDVLADHSTNEIYKKSMQEAKKAEETSQSDFLTLFIEAYKRNSNGANLARVFATQQLKGKVATNSTDKEVEAALRAEIQSAVDNAEIVVRTRIDKFGVVQPNIQKLEGQSRIMVEMPGVKEPERVRKLLQGSANLEFWETYNASEVFSYLRQVEAEYLNTMNGGTAETAEVEAAADTVQTENGIAAAIKSDEAKAAAKDAESDELAAELKRNPLQGRLHFTGNQSLSTVGYCLGRDTVEVNKIIYSDIAMRILPSDLKLLWSAKPVEEGSAFYELHAIKVTTSNGRAPLEGDVIVSASDEFDHYSGRPCVSMQMNGEGARRWAQLTKLNIGKAIAIVLDNTVYSAPRVNGEIAGGNSQITGNFTIQDTKDLANTLNSGKMPAPTRIVQEEVVGPSLGAQSINQGINSFILAFVLLMFYMFALYGKIPGAIANSALLLNLFFTLGILTSFQSALTMPGIAGIVLMLGMAVDANVLIFERTKEELRAGSNVKEALYKGYSNAFSAIFDSNLTSVITGIILATIGTGPIKGFAVTLIIGIVCSFFTAVFLTRLVFENQMKKDKWLNLSFETSFSRKIMKATKFDFVGARKKSFTAWGVIAAVIVVSFATLGLSLGIDFTGGRNYVVQMAQQTEPEDVRALLSETFPGCNTGAIALGTDGKTIRISTNYKIESNDPTVDDECENMLYASLTKAGMITQKDINAFKNPDVKEGGSIISSTKVGPSMAKTILIGAIWSVIIALGAIFLYILFRFRNVAYSVGSTVALVLDALLVIGSYSLLYKVLPMSLEIDQTFIGAILTVIGYSINDKVVVFDRMRENFQLFPKRDRLQIFNDSLNQTLARTINTSMSTLVVLVCICALGGQSIRSFTFAMILGVVFGTLSSIFIASPVAYIVMGKTKKDEKK